MLSYEDLTKQQKEYVKEQYKTIRENEEERELEYSEIDFEVLHDMMFTLDKDNAIEILI